MFQEGKKKEGRKWAGTVLCPEPLLEIENLARNNMWPLGLGVFHVQSTWWKDGSD